jgi:hypothetical protein
MLSAHRIKVLEAFSDHTHISFGRNINSDALPHIKRPRETIYRCCRTFRREIALEITWKEEENAQTAQAWFVDDDRYISASHQ